MNIRFFHKILIFLLLSGLPGLLAENPEGKIIKQIRPQGIRWTKIDIVNREFDVGSLRYHLGDVFRFREVPWPPVPQWAGKHPLPVLLRCEM